MKCKSCGAEYEIWELTARMCSACHEKERQARERRAQGARVGKNEAPLGEAELIAKHEAAIAERKKQSGGRLKRAGHPTCKLCGSEYNIFTAKLCEGLCKACSEELAAIRKAKYKQLKEVPRQTATATDSGRVPSDPNAFFYYRAKGEEKGPFTLGQLRSMWDNGQIIADALHRTSDSSEWLPLLSRFAETTRVSDAAIAAGAASPTVTASPTEQRPQKAVSGGEKKSASNAYKWGLGFAAILVLLIIIGAIFGPSNFSSNSSPSSGNSTSNKSARQLLTDRAEALYGRNAHVEVDGGFYGGAYTVTIWTDSHNYTFAAEVDEKAQRVTAWQLTASH